MAPSTIMLLRSSISSKANSETFGVIRAISAYFLRAYVQIASITANCAGASISMRSLCAMAIDGGKIESLPSGGADVVNTICKLRQIQFMCAQRHLL